MRRENGLWQKVRVGLGAEIAALGGRLDRVENGVTEGMPDVNGTVLGIDLWVELKNRSEVPRRESTRVLGNLGLNIDQINWHLRHARAGGRSFILVGLGKELYLAPGCWARELNGWTLLEWRQRGQQILGWQQLLGLLLKKEGLE